MHPNVLQKKRPEECTDSKIDSTFMLLMAKKVAWTRFNIKRIWLRARVEMIMRSQIIINEEKSRWLNNARIIQIMNRKHRLMTTYCREIQTSNVFICSGLPTKSCVNKEKQILLVFVSRRYSIYKLYVLINTFKIKLHPNRPWNVKIFCSLICDLRRVKILRGQEVVRGGYSKMYEDYIIYKWVREHNNKYFCILYLYSAAYKLNLLIFSKQLKYFKL